MLTINPNGASPKYLLLAVLENGEIEPIAAFHIFPTEKELGQTFETKSTPGKFILAEVMAVTPARTEPH